MDHRGMTLPPVHRPPRIPRFDRWAPAIRSAERLRGTLVTCGPGHRLVGWPDSPRVRAQALAPWLTERRIAVGLSAAWVWGAAQNPGRPLRFATRDGTRAPRAESTDYTIQQFALIEDDVEQLGDFAVTSPLRTVFDLLRAPQEFGVPHRVACRLLLIRATGGTEAVRERLAAGGRPYRKLALERLLAC